MIRHQWVFIYHCQFRKVKSLLIFVLNVGFSWFCLALSCKTIPLHLKLMTNVLILCVWHEAAFPFVSYCSRADVSSSQMPLATHKPLMLFTHMPTIFMIQIMWPGIHVYVIAVCIINEEKALSFRLIMIRHSRVSLKLTWNVFTV